MKIRCDFCDKEEASVFCSADEAALCGGCDHQIHLANKLARKHQRFSLLQPTFKDSPLCDICQERRALLFCREDRAILCRKCDVPIHKANEHTQKHSRFLLTGVKLSAQNPTISISSFEPSTSVSFEISNSASKGRTKGKLNYGLDDRHLSEPNSSSTASISEYLMETIPGWRFEDFCDPPSSAHNSLCKNADPFFPNLNQELKSNIFFLSEDLPFWVPQVPIQPTHFLPQSGLVDESKVLCEANTVKASRTWNEDGFTVPEFSPALLKKPRNF